MKKKSNGSRHRILYVGFDIHTLQLIAKEPTFDLLSINLISEFLHLPTRNPVNLIFRLVYFLRYLQKFRIIEIFLLFIFRVLTIFSSSVFRKYSSYLYLISTKRLTIINLSQTDQAIESLSILRIDAMIINNWWMLPEKLVKAPRYGAINIHPSILPQYRGSLPTLWTLKNGDPSSAVSYMKINAKMDEGSLIAQHMFDISIGETALSLEKKIETVISTTFVDDLKAYLDETRSLIDQDQSKASKTAKFTEYQCIDWSREKAKDIQNKIILYPYLWPLDQCHAYFKDRKVYFKTAVVDEPRTDIKLNHPGDFVRSGLFLYIQAADFPLKIYLPSSVGFFDLLWFLKESRPF